MQIKVALLSAEEGEGVPVIHRCDPANPLPTRAPGDTHARAYSARASRTLMCVEVIQGSCTKAGSHSVNQDGA